MIAVDPYGWRWLRWRVLQWVLAVMVSLILLGGAALEAGRRLVPVEPGHDGRLVSFESSPWRPT
jgi:hypothetical protein